MCSGDGCGAGGICEAGLTQLCTLPDVCDGTRNPPGHCVECTQDSHCNDNNECSIDVCNTVAGTCDNSGFACNSTQVCEDLTCADIVDTGETPTSGDENGAGSAIFESAGVRFAIGFTAAIGGVAAAVMFNNRRAKERSEDEERDEFKAKAKKVMSVSQIPGLEPGGKAQAGILYSKPAGNAATPRRGSGNSRGSRGGRKGKK